MSIFIYGRSPEKHKFGLQDVEHSLPVKFCPTLAAATEEKPKNPTSMSIRDQGAIFVADRSEEKTTW